MSEPEAQYKLNQSKENVSAETVELDRSGEVRQPMMLSPKSPVYNRFKYYSALRTGYEQLNPAEKSPFLRAPKQVIEPLLYYVHAPFGSHPESGEPIT